MSHLASSQLPASSMLRRRIPAKRPPTPAEAACLVPAKRRAPQAAAYRSAQANRRMRLFSAKRPPIPVQQGGQSLLEQIVTLDSTRLDYRRRLEVFLGWLKALSLAPTTPDDVLLSLMDFLDEMFFCGASHADGSKLLAALLDLMPELRGCTVGLARAQRALRGWGKRAPANSRFPPPVIAVLGIVLDLIWRRLPLHALAVLVQFLAYLRPGELLELQTGQIIPPSRAPGSHSGRSFCTRSRARGAARSTSATSLLLDAPDWEAANIGLSELIHFRQSHEPLWPFDYASYAREIETSVHTCELGQYTRSP